MTEPFYSYLSSGLATSEIVTGTVIHKTYFYHGIRIHYRTNHRALLPLLESIPGISSTAVEVRGSIVYALFCYQRAADFPVTLPREREGIEKVQLVTGSTVKYYRGADHTLYQRFLAQPPLHGNVLTVLYANRCEALTQIEWADVEDNEVGEVDSRDWGDRRNEAGESATHIFLRRYIVLLALGELLRTQGFEPCHAAAISAPWDQQQGALLLGDSGSGKTTASLGCTLAGCGLLGDDLLLLRQERGEHDQSKIQAYAIFPEISVRSPSLDLWPALSFLKSYPADQRDKRFCLPEALRPGAGRLTVPIQLLFFPTLTNESVSTVHPMSKAAVLSELVRLGISKEHGATRPELQQQQFQLLTALAGQAQGYQLFIARGDQQYTQLICRIFKRGVR